MAKISILKSRKGSRAVWAAAALLCLAAAGTGVYLYDTYKARNRYGDLPPVVREMIALNEKVKASTIGVYEASQKLDSLGMVQSRLSDIKTTLGLIDKMRQLIDANQADIDALVSYIEKHGDFIRRHHLDWAFWIGKFYEDPVVIAHNQSRTRYFNAFEELLRYTYDNFNNIMELKSSQHMANYDAYYLRYRGVADGHNRINRKRIDFQNQFIAEHPEVRPFLPGSHQLEPFKFWDKFNF